MLVECRKCVGRQVAAQGDGICCQYAAGYHQQRAIQTLSPAVSGMSSIIPHLTAHILLTRFNPFSPHWALTVDQTALKSKWSSTEIRTYLKKTHCKCLYTIIYLTRFFHSHGEQQKLECLFKWWQPDYSSNQYSDGLGCSCDEADVV